MVVLVTGGAGFIGSNFLLRSVVARPDLTFVNVDALTYAGNPYSLEAIAEAPNYRFEHVDITDRAAVDQVFDKHDPTVVVHLAAESHVDRSIASPDAFIRTNINGTFHLLEAFRGHSAGKEGARFHHVSTDEVYGSLGPTGLFREDTPYDPSSPYSASKAASDHLVRAHARTFGVPVTITNCSNNYGARQFPEKLIPLMVLKALAEEPLPVYGTGENVRDWLHVDDHCEAIWAVLDRGKVGETYNVGGRCELTNLDVVHQICDVVAAETQRDSDALRKLITFVRDRPGHDLRYAIDASKIERECGWTPSVSFTEGLRQTVRWYLENPEWIARVRSGEYRRWLAEHYDGRHSA
ncbi:MAG: dTDP-glucose 4,6-dehydratase [Proteobacteria bacterium]|nr:dTDP-glucose 4,6-dehydratase [Pseudomonadota bacterium]